MGWPVPRDIIQARQLYTWLHRSLQYSLTMQLPVDNRRCNWALMIPATIIGPYGHRGRIARGRPTTHQINGFRMRASIWAEASSRFVAIWAEKEPCVIRPMGLYTNFESWGKVA